MFPPPLLGFIVAVVIIFLNIKIPKVFLTFFSYLGSVSAPLSMIFIGIVISNVRLADLKHNRNLVLMAVTRIMFLPLIMYILVINSNLPIASVRGSSQFGGMKKANRDSKIEVGQTNTRRLLWPRSMIMSC